MEISKILTADVLDIIFEGRNKDYGAYDLRRTYGRRLKVSIAVMFSFMGLLYGGMVLANKTGNNKPVELAVKDMVLEDIKKTEKEPELPPPPKQQEPVKIKTEKLVDQIKIVPDDQPVDPIPPVDVLEDVKIGNMKVDGANDVGILAPPSDAGVGTGVIELPKKQDEDQNRIFIKVEQESEYPGGATAWKRFLERNLRYPDEALDAGLPAKVTVTVQFIVDKEGNVSDVQVVEGPRELQAESIRVIKKSGKWTPAIQNGHPVRSYKKQPISFWRNEE